MPNRQGQPLKGNMARIPNAVEAYHAGLIVPGGEAAWERISGRLADRRRLHVWNRRLRLAGVAVLVMLAVQLFFGGLKPVQALARFFLEVRQHEGTTSMLFGDYDWKEPAGMLTGPPPKEERYGRTARSDEAVAPFSTEQGRSYKEQFRAAEGGLDGREPVSHDAAAESYGGRRQLASVEEAALLVSFPILTPRQLPEGISLKQVVVFLNHGEEKSGGVFLEYRSDSGGGFEVHQMRKAEQYGSATTVSDPDAQVKEVAVGHSRGVILISGSFVHLQWLTDTMSYTVSGLLTEKEALAIACSLF